MRTELTQKAKTELEESFRNDQEAHRLLDLVNAEFESDRQSVQCFDLRVVRQVKTCVETRKRLVRSNPLID